MERARVALAASTHCPELAFDCLYNRLLHRSDLGTFTLFAFALALVVFALALSAFALAFLALAFVVLAFVAFVLGV